MKHTVRTGLSFGLTSGVITTLGLLVGLSSGTNSEIAVVGGILAIAIADALSDSLGIHITEEAKDTHSAKEVWESTIATFLFKFVTAITFIVPVLLLELSVAVFVSIAWGMFLLAIFSFYVAKDREISSWKVIGEHVAIGLVVVLVSHYVGVWVKLTFGW